MEDAVAVAAEHAEPVQVERLAPLADWRSCRLEFRNPDEDLVTDFAARRSDH